MTGREHGQEPAVELLRELVEFHDEDCWFDHHGYCQAHGWMETDPSCPVARTKRFLARAESSSPDREGAE